MPAILTTQDLVWSKSLRTEEIRNWPPLIVLLSNNKYNTRGWDQRSHVIDNPSEKKLRLKKNRGYKKKGKYKKQENHPVEIVIEAGRAKDRKALEKILLV